MYNPYPLSENAFWVRVRVIIRYVRSVLLRYFRVTCWATGTRLANSPPKLGLRALSRPGTGGDYLGPDWMYGSTCTNQAVLFQVKRYNSAPKLNRARSKRHSSSCRPLCPYYPVSRQQLRFYYQCWGFAVEVVAQRSSLGGTRSGVDPCYGRLAPATIFWEIFWRYDGHNGWGALHLTQKLASRKKAHY